MESSRRHAISSSFGSAEADSHHGTPETKMTALSPEDIRTTKATLASDSPPSFSLGTVPMKACPAVQTDESVIAGSQDPFVTSSLHVSTQYGAEPPKLSPVASAFTPSGLQGSFGGTNGSRGSTLPCTLTERAMFQMAGNSLSAPVSPETAYGETALKEYLSSVASRSSTSRASIAPSPSTGPSVDYQLARSGRFSSDGNVSRSLQISGVDQNTSAADLENLISVSRFSYINDNVD